MGRRPEQGDILGWLAEGDLRSDGLAREVADLVVSNPGTWDDLLHALFHGADAVRGHAADAVERVSRLRPSLLGKSVPTLAEQAQRDPVPMVRWHLAMVMGNIAHERSQAATCARTLLALLGDASPFVRSWAISGLCQVARLYPARSRRILNAIARLASDPSIAVRHRATMALSVLSDPRRPLPATWVKRRQ